jgi:hypothetical protein
LAVKVGQLCFESYASGKNVSPTVFSNVRSPRKLHGSFSKSPLRHQRQSLFKYVLARGQNIARPVVQLFLHVRNVEPTLCRELR